MSEQRFIFSSNEVGFSLNIELDFLAKGTYGTKEIDFKSFKNYFLQLKVVKHGLIKEIVNPINRFFLQKNNN